MQWLLAIAAIAFGFMATMQIAINKQIGDRLQNVLIPSIATMFVGFLATMVIAAVLTKQWPSGDALRSVPWYAFIAGGAIGAVYVTGNIALAPKLGAAALIALVVTGQLVLSVVFDQFGWFGYEQRTAGALRLLGTALMIGGVALISKY